MASTALSKHEIDPGTLTLVELSIRAGRAIMDVYDGEDVGLAEKADGSPVTVADGRAEALILQGLKDAFPDVPVVAEEAVEAGLSLPDADRYFLVDPLDGTKEFLKRNGEFTVNIALVDHGVPVFGVVYAPALGEIYWGGSTAVQNGPLGRGEETGPDDGKGAFFARVQEDAVLDVVPIRVSPPPAGSLCALTSRSHACAETEALIARLNVGKRVSVGSSLKLCWVAAGKADIYPRLAPTMQWDIAAGDAVLRAAGGCVVDMSSGGNLAYRVPPNAVKDDLKNPKFIAACHPGLLPDRDLAG